MTDNASEKEIKASYKKLVKQWHPDKHTDPQKKAEAQEKFMEIQQAYEILSKISHKRMRMNKKDRRGGEDHDRIGKRRNAKDEF